MLSIEAAKKRAEEIRQLTERLKADKKKSKKKKRKRTEDGNGANQGDVDKPEPKKVQKVETLESAKAADEPKKAERQAKKVERNVTVAEVRKVESSVEETKKAKRFVDNPYLKSYDQEDDGDVFVDSRIVKSDSSREKREKKAFQLVPQGEYIKMAELKRAREAHLAFIRDRRNKDSRRHFRDLLGKEQKDGGIDSSLVPKMVLRRVVVPDIEWWDKPFHADECFKLERQKSYKLVEHPAEIEPLVPEAVAREIPLYLTRAERKKKRRQDRQKRQQELQDKISAGLIEPPPPKVKISNMMRVLGDDAVLDPSKLEKEVIKAIEERKLNHRMRNEANKKTPQEKYEKTLAKVAQDSKGPPVVAVYRVDDICRPAELAAQNRFKIDANAKKLHLSGCVVILPEPIQLQDGTLKRCNIVVLEGGEKRLQKMEKQMMNRIKW
eukprot:CAMPEP_0203762934 /NCGR_PEP_ID=MMETSP0098-20131031/15702_1 /ASSEMBLY_ACC=CAM_ASM_000208 /TAXON_ID=96639 /ORGANISM=" , Strain NY0313808BC1" /LENGTH=437 /DNA_ID=CAMNT_0050657531 /DNA_START=139 /DNA_END=1449 /DNA_ORIENTATION=-